MEGSEEEAPVRQLQRLMRQHRQELVLQVGGSSPKHTRYA
jgi:hypothetical protein